MNPLPISHKKIISATKTKNFLLRDPLLDWLNLYGFDKGYLKNSNQNKFTDFLKKKGVEFEKKIFNHIRSKYPNLSQNELSKKVLSFVKTKNTNFYYHKENGDFWNVMIFIDDSITHEIVKHKEIAYENLHTPIGNKPTKLPSLFLFRIKSLHCILRLQTKEMMVLRL